VDTLNHLKEKFSITDIVGIIAGSLIVAVGIQGVLVPAHLLTGGVSGVAMILQYVFGVDIWLWLLVFNIPIFIAGYRFVSSRFVIYSLLGTGFLTLFLALLKPLNFGIDDALLSALAGGVITGIGTGIVLHCKASTGGTDIIAVIVRRYWGYNFGQTFMVINLSIISLFLFISSLELALYSAISIFVSSRMVDIVVAGPHVGRTAFIISHQSEEISRAIINILHRGCTSLSGQGAYSGETRQIIMVTLGKTQIPRLKEIVFEIDRQAFIIINETIEVYGKGFISGINDF
jgi:uncharacterized membrane-anchored protein YitT (DUF2179 family)